MDDDINYQRLEENIMDIIMEQQLKLGYLKETVRLYYPLSSLNRLLGTECGTGELLERMQQFSAWSKEHLGGMKVTAEGERFCIAVPPEGAAYIHDHGKKNSFLKNLIQTVGQNGCSVEDVFQVFRNYSEHVHIEKMSGKDFDYLVYFEDGTPDRFRYCITVEECHVIYHRYTKEDYEELFQG